jgi:hypothetical protein
VCGVAKQECASIAKVVGDSMVDVIRREPVHALDINTHPFNHASADIVPGQGLIPVRRVGLISLDQPRASRIFEREDGKEIGAIEPDVKISIHHRSVGVDVGDVDEMLVRSARETDR